MVLEIKGPAVYGRQASIYQVIKVNFLLLYLYYNLKIIIMKSLTPDEKAFNQDIRNQIAQKEQEQQYIMETASESEDFDRMTQLEEDINRLTEKIIIK